MAILRKKQRGLQNEIAKKRREASQLNARIDRLIAEEIEKALGKRAAEEARREAAAARKKRLKRLVGNVRFRKKVAPLELIP